MEWNDSIGVFLEKLAPLCKFSEVEEEEYASRLIQYLKDEREIVHVLCVLMTEIGALY